MLLSKAVIIKWNKATKKYYENKGYIFTKYDDEFEVNIKDLQHGSSTLIEYSCDYCHSNGIETILKCEYKNYKKRKDNSIIKKDCCKKCKSLKYSESNLKVYGVEHVSQLDEIKNKIKETCLKKYGVEHISQLPEIKNKKKQTYLDKYGVESPMQLEEFKNKAEETNIEKYGCKSPMQNEEVKEKTRQTNLVKYGVDNPLKNKNIQEKVKNTNLEKYGVEFPTQNKEIYKKIKSTNLKKYGVEAPIQCEEIAIKTRQTNMDRYGAEYATQNEKIKERVKQTNLERYGVENPIQYEEFKVKAMTNAKQTLYKNGTQNTSSQQLKVYEMLKAKEYNVELNYPISNISLDIALFIENVKIDIEYDGWYWHQNEYKDRRRDEFLKSEGWKILRIKSSKKIPNLKCLHEAIIKLINSDRKYTQIVLDDWGGGVIVNE